MIETRNERIQKSHLIFKSNLKNSKIGELLRRPKTVLNTQFHYNMNKAKKIPSNIASLPLTPLSKKTFFSTYNNAFPIRFTKRACKLSKRLFLSMTSSQSPETTINHHMEKIIKNNALNISSIEGSQYKTIDRSSIGSKISYYSKNNKWIAKRRYIRNMRIRCKTSMNKRTVKIVLPDTVHELKDNRKHKAYVLNFF